MRIPGPKAEQSRCTATLLDGSNVLLRLLPFCTYCYQDAPQRIQVWFGSGCEQQLRTGNVTVGNGKEEGSLPEIAVVLCNKLYIGAQGLVTLGDKDVQL